MSSLVATISRRFLTAAICSVLSAGFLLSFAGCGNSSADAEPASDLKTDKFRFYYRVTINELEPGKKARVWLPIAQVSHAQEVELGEIDVPGDHEIHEEEEYGNKVIYFEAIANDRGEIPVNVTYEVTRKELTAETGAKVVEAELDKYLAPSRLVPVGDELLARVVGETRPEGNSREVAGQLYDAVYERMQYGKPEGQPVGKNWGRGDATYACDVKVGNCTDFHSLFISMCRTLKLPAKFEIGFMLPPDKQSGDVAGYHCWAKFASDGRWIPVDISEADKDKTLKEYYFGSLTPNRVTFTTGRDLALEPSPANEAVNFFVYPYVEVDGEQHTPLTKHFRFERIEKSQDDAA